MCLMFFFFSLFANAKVAGMSFLPLSCFRSGSKLCDVCLDDYFETEKKIESSAFWSWILIDKRGNSGAWSKSFFIGN